MSSFKILFFSSFLLFQSYVHLILAAYFVIENNCPYTLWAVAVPGKSRRLDRGQTLSFNHSEGSGSIWARTNCNFNAIGIGKCESGDCDGLLDCGSTILPRGPATLAEYTLGNSDNMDYFSISVIRGFNVPMEFRATSNDCNQGIKCAADINELCPTELRDPGGCNNPCEVFKNDQFCCRSSAANCGPTAYSMFFKDLCPSVYTYAYDDANSTFSCPGGSQYKVVFCPSNTLVNDHGQSFQITNSCPYTVWAAAVPGGGRELNQGETWTISVMPGTTAGRIWARTGCQFDAAGKGKCQTGDCNGVLQCTGYGVPPNTLAEFALDQFEHRDFIDISNIDGFNVPMEFSAASGKCTHVIKCTADIVGQCPTELKVPGGCNGPCPVFKTDEYCCNSGDCGPTNYSRFFKDRCPDAYSYPKDDTTSIFTCPGGTNYKVVFCP